VRGPGSVIEEAHANVIASGVQVFTHMLKPRSLRLLPVEAVGKVPCRQIVGKGKQITTGRPVWAQYGLWLYI
jgi:hypothetical protein